MEEQERIIERDTLTRAGLNPFIEYYPKKVVVGGIHLIEKELAEKAISVLETKRSSTLKEVLEVIDDQERGWEFFATSKESAMREIEYSKFALKIMVELKQKIQQLEKG